MTQGIAIYKLTAGDTLMSLQVHQKRPNCVTCDNTFLSLPDYVLPFLFTRVASSNDITSFEIFTSSDVLETTLDNSLISIVNAGGIDFITCNFQATKEDALACGLYYYRIEFGSEIYYSEIFRVINKDLGVLSEDIAVNGDFATDLSGWTVSGATWTAPGAHLVVGNTISQLAPGESMVKITVTTTNTYLQGMEFKLGAHTFNLPPNTSTIFYVPSGVIYTIKNNDISGGNDLTVSLVTAFSLEKIECYNLIIAR